MVIKLSAVTNKYSLRGNRTQNGYSISLQDRLNKCWEYSIVILGLFIDRNIDTRKTATLARENGHVRAGLWLARDAHSKVINSKAMSESTPLRKNNLMHCYQVSYS